MKIFGVPIPFTKRASPSVTDDRWWTGSNVVYLGDETPVTPETALRFTAVFAAVRVIAGNLASLPLITYEHRPDGGREKATKHPLYKLLKTKPNRQKMTAFEFREMLTGHMLLYGNGYAQIIRNDLDEIVQLIPLHPTRVTPAVENKALIYKVKADATTVRVFPEEQILHLRAFRDSGLEGLSAISAARKAIEAGLSLESFAANFFQGGAFPAGVLEVEGQGVLPDAARENLRDSWQELHGGANRGKRIAVLEAGIKWKPMGIPQQDAQFLEQRRFGVEEIARIFGVPPHLLGDLSRSTNNNIETQSQEFLTYCLRPWMERWEQTIVRDLLDGEDEPIFVKHNATALLRGDSTARGEFYAKGIQNGWFSKNDVRALEDMNPIGPEGDIYLSPVNMVPAGQEGKDPEPAKEPVKEEPKKELPPPAPEKKALEPERVKAAFYNPVFDAWERIARKEINAVRNAAKKKTGEEFSSWLAEFTEEHHAFACSCLRELAISYHMLRDERPSGRSCIAAVEEYAADMKERALAWMSEPAKGYDRKEDEVATYWTERMLGYSRTGYETAA